MTTSQRDDDTLSFVGLEATADSVRATSFHEGRIEISAITHRGKVRAVNEDQYSVVRRTRASVVLASSLDQRQLAAGEDRAWSLVVADGMGGEVAGDIASSTAVQTIMEVASRLSSWIMRPVDDLHDDLAERVELYADAIQRALQQRAESDPSLAGMGTTLTTAHIIGSDAIITNVGDSRSYLIRSGQLRQITEDHTLAEDLKRKGVPEALSETFSNLLTRCFSTTGEPVDVDVFHVPLRADDHILLCSDGLTDMVADDVILKTVQMNSSTGESCEQLVSAALQNGGRDNITMILAQIVEL